MSPCFKNRSSLSLPRPPPSLSRTSPLVQIAGVVASLLSRPEYEDLSPVALKRKLATMANKNAINMGIIPPWGGKTKNLLVFSDPPAHEDKKPEGDEDEEMTDL